MKYKILALLCLSWASSVIPRFFIPQLPQKIPFVSSLYYPKEIQNPQRLAILYKGDIYKPAFYSIESNHKADLEIFEDRNCAEMFILVTESLQIPKDHAITYLSTSAKHPYRIFKLTKKTHYNHKTQEEVPTVSYSWDIEELKNKESSYRLAENTIIFLMDPSLVELEPTTGKPDDVFIKLPSIAFKKIANEESFNKLCRRMLLSVMDFKFFHKDSCKTSKHIAANCVVSLPSPANYLIS